MLPETDVSRKSGVPSSMLPKLFRSGPCCFLGLSVKDPSQSCPVPAVSCIVMADLTLPDSLQLSEPRHSGFLPSALSSDPSVPLPDP